jgi:hypothetical protein
MGADFDAIFQTASMGLQDIRDIASLEEFLNVWAPPVLHAKHALAFETYRQ